MTSPPQAGPEYRMLQVRDVTLRDGLQLTGKILTTERKVDLVRQLLAAGISAVEIGSMARPDLVPSMGNTLEVIAALSAAELAHCWVWVATPGQVKRAIDAGVTNLQFCLSASDAHNQANLARSTEESLASMPAAADLVQAAGGRLQLCIATSFTCPFDGNVAPEGVLAIASDPRTVYAKDIVICDTLGQATPAEVARLVGMVREDSPPRRIFFHGHDTWGQGVANSLAAFAAGAEFVDGSLAGLGGCPFAPGASGNASTEDLLFATRPGWLTPRVLNDLVASGSQLVAELGEPNRSRTAEGVRVSQSTFPWAASAPTARSGGGGEPDSSRARTA